jgi:hypothetical protein
VDRVQQVFDTNCLRPSDALRYTIIASVPADAIKEPILTKSTKRIQLGSSVLEKLKQYEAKKELKIQLRKTSVKVIETKAKLSTLKRIAK